MTWNDSSRPATFPLSRRIVICTRRIRRGLLWASVRVQPFRGKKFFAPTPPSCARKPLLPVTALWCLSNRSGFDKSSHVAALPSADLVQTKRCFVWPRFLRVMSSPLFPRFPRPRRICRRHWFFRRSSSPPMARLPWRILGAPCVPMLSNTFRNQGALP